MCNNFIQTRDPKEAEAIFDAVSAYAMQWHLEVGKFYDDVLFKFCFVLDEDYTTIDELLSKPKWSN